MCHACSYQDIEDGKTRTGPPQLRGRCELETLMASAAHSDWLALADRVSAMHAGMHAPCTAVLSSSLARAMSLSGCQRGILAKRTS
eukprot:COSAG01_NODE_966_length_12397_cov_146.646528_11_plen_86_part_00